MTTIAPLLARPTALLPRANPTAKLLAVVAVSIAAFVAVDPVTPALLLAGELALLPASGLHAPALLRRAWPALVAALGVAVANAVFGTAHGAVLLRVGPLEVTSGSLAGGLAIALRVLAIALPGVVVLAATDPTDLADSLVQQCRVPARFALGALAAVRLLPLLGQEWRSIALARRARGVDAGGNPLAALRLFAGQAFTLLVGAIRRGTRLATAMDARGFDSGVPRTVARPQTVRRADVALVTGAVLLGALASLISIAVGSWHPLIG